jgi:hypothetical protein
MFVFKRKVEFNKLKKLLDENQTQCCCCKGAQLIDFKSIVDGLAKVVCKILMIEAFTRVFFYFKN